MKEDIFLKFGMNTKISNEIKKKRWTSKIKNSIFKNKVVLLLLIIALIFTVMNFWLIYSFVNILGNHI